MSRLALWLGLGITVVAACEPRPRPPLREDKAMNEKPTPRPENPPPAAGPSAPADRPAPPAVEPAPAQPADEVAGLLADLRSGDPATRARAAVALHQRRHPQALAACLQTLDDAADELHLDRTPAVQCLIELGAPALQPLLAPLQSPAAMTRLHAQRAVEGITRRRHGFDGRAWPPGALDRWLKFWEGIGYDSKAAAPQRAAAIARLESWIGGR